MNPVLRPSWSSRIDPSLLVLLATATALFAAGMSTLSLESLDDAFYARKGVEMARSGGFFTVTWAGQPTFQNPPLQIWFIGQSHSLFGEGDLAARFPSLLMALATLVITNRIGLRLVGRQCALTAVALLLVTPLFVNGARGCMMEMPQVFWVSLAMLIAIEGRDRPNLLLLLALPLGAGILTKSVLGLLPMLVLGAAAWSEEYRRLWRTRQLWTALVLGIILGSLWPVHQALTLGSEAIRAHYLGEIAGRSIAEFSLGRLPILLPPYSTEGLSAGVDPRSDRGGEYLEARASRVASEPCLTARVDDRTALGLQPLLGALGAVCLPNLACPGPVWRVVAGLGGPSILPSSGYPTRSGRSRRRRIGVDCVTQPADP